MDCFVYVFVLFLKFYFYFWSLYLGPCCCVWAFSSCGECGLLSSTVPGLLIAVAFFRCAARALAVQASAVQPTGSVVVAHGLNWSAACGIFPDHGLNRCPLHWQGMLNPWTTREILRSWTSNNIFHLFLGSSDGSNSVQLLTSG